MVDTTDEFLDDAAQSQFGAVASNIGTILTVGATLVLVAVLVNMAFQYKSMDGRTAFWLAVKLTLISIFSLNWSQFNIVADSIIGGLDFVAGALVASVGGGGAGATHFAAEFDQMIDNFSQYLNAVGTNLNWMAGAMMGALGAFFLGVVGALCGLVLIFAKIMLTFMLGIAPIMKKGIKAPILVAEFGSPRVLKRDCAIPTIVEKTPAITIGYIAYDNVLESQR